MDRTTLLLAAVSIFLFALDADQSAAFGSAAGTCVEPIQTFHGFPSAGTGGFSIVATRDGAPVTEVLPGETVEVTLSRPAGYRGVLIRANEGSSSGSPVGGLAVSDASTQQLEPACAVPGSGISHTFDPSPVPALRTSDVVTWTAPAELEPGDQVVISAFPVVEMLEWYGAAPSPINVSLGIIAAPVPSLGAPMLLALAAGLALASWLRIDRGRQRA